MNGRSLHRLLMLCLLVGLLSVTPPAVGAVYAQGLGQIFPDVPPTFFAFSDIQALAAQGVIRGFADGFHPADGLTRGQMAALLDRAINTIGRTGWAQPGPTANSALIFAPLASAAADADFVLLQSTDGVTFTPNTTTAAFLGQDLITGFAEWSVTDVTVDTLFLPVLMLNGVQVPLSSAIEARPQLAQEKLIVINPIDGATGVSRLPQFRWETIDDREGTVMFVVTVETTGTTPVVAYQVGLEAWRTFVRLNQLRGPGIVFANTVEPFIPSPLAASTGFTLTVRAVDTSGWAFAEGVVGFTTAPAL